MRVRACPYRAFVLGSQVLHVDETPVNMLDPGAGKTKRAYIWAYARGRFDARPGVAYDFCVGRAAHRDDLPHRARGARTEHPRSAGSTAGPGAATVGCVLRLAQAGAL